MQLIFSPVRLDERLTASVAGDVLVLNGVPFDFGPLPAGGTLPRAAIDSPWIAGDVTRDLAGVVSVPLILPHGGRAPAETLFPAPITVESGPAPLPAYDQPEELADADD